MTKIAESLGAVYIYIYIVRFNKIEEKLCFLGVQKKSNWHSFFMFFSVGDGPKSKKFSVGDVCQMGRF